MKKLNLENIAQTTIAVLAGISVPFLPFFLTLLLSTFVDSQLVALIGLIVFALLLFPLWIFAVIKGPLYKSKISKAIVIFLVVCSLILCVFIIADTINYLMKLHPYA